MFGSRAPVFFWLGTRHSPRLAVNVLRIDANVAAPQANQVFPYDPPRESGTDYRSEALSAHWLPLVVPGD